MIIANPNLRFIYRDRRDNRFINTRALCIGLTALSLAGCSSISQTDFCARSSLKPNAKAERCETPNAFGLIASSGPKNKFQHNAFGELTNKKRNRKEESEKDSNVQKLIKEISDIYSNHSSIKASGLSKSSFYKLFVALIRQESNFNTKAVSPAGAKGLGQLMPATARELGVRNPFQARANLDGSARYLIRMLAKFKSVDKALAAYNAGPGRVLQYGGVPPFKETQNYIKKIREYSRLNWNTPK